MFPRVISKKISPPIVIQGSKRKLLNFIFKNIHWENKKKGKWIELFLGSGIVFINALYHGKFKKAIINDINPHIIRLYEDIINKRINPRELKKSLIQKAKRLRKGDHDYYYELRDQFNEEPSSELLIFLNLTCFQNLMRFNKKGEFNSPLYKDEARGVFNKNDISFSYFSNYAKRIKFLQELFQRIEIETYCLDFKELLRKASKEDFVYLDPPYLLKDITYFSKTFGEKDFYEIENFLKDSESSICLSNWYSDLKNGKVSFNPYVKDLEENNMTHHIIKKQIIHNMGEGKHHQVVECLILNDKAISGSKGIKLGLEKYI